MSAQPQPSSLSSTSDLPFSLAQRTARIEPFHVMQMIKLADQLAAQGKDIIHLSIGEPDFTAPPAVSTAAQAALDAGRTAYTNALGISPLRAAIAQWYKDAFGLEIAPERIVLTAGASAALLLVFAALVDPQSEVLMPDPSYPCNRHFVSAVNGQAKLIPSGPEKRFQLTAQDVASAWGIQTKGVLLASPSNPTGTTIEMSQLSAIAQEVRARSGFLAVDEIYLPLTYDQAPGARLVSALSLGDDIISINSFSKYFAMTGWRLGWVVAPPALVPTLEKLAQNLFICPSAIAQHAALACFMPESLALCEARRKQFEQRRDLLLAQLPQLKLHVPVKPDGAFYIYADISATGLDSDTFARRLLQDTGVCVVPGLDFGIDQPHRYVRISYATKLERIEEALKRMGAWIQAM